MTKRGVARCHDLLCGERKMVIISSCRYIPNYLFLCVRGGRVGVGGTDVVVIMSSRVTFVGERLIDTVVMIDSFAL